MTIAAILIVICLFVMLVIGVPIGVAFGLGALALALVWGIQLSMFESVPYQAVSLFPLLAIPLFMLVGELMKEGRMSDDLIDFSERIAGRLRGALGHSVIAASALMSLITGSSVATVAAIGSVVTKPMEKRGYKLGYIGALVAVSALLGVLIPPSIPLVLYGSVVGVSITQLLVASMLPGILATLVLAIVHWRMLPKVLPNGQEIHQYTQNSDGTPISGSFNNVLLRALPSLSLTVIIFGGLYTGWFTPTEVAGVAAVFILLVSFAMRRLNLKTAYSAFRAASIMTAAIFTILLFTSLFNRVITLEQLPQYFAEFFINITDNKYLFLLLVNVMLLLVGMFMETNAAVLLLGPLLAPSAAKYNIDPVHFGIIVVTNIELGLITPPMAGNLFVAAKVTGAPMSQILKYLPYFFVSMVLFQLALTFIPALSLWYRYLP